MPTKKSSASEITVKSLLRFWLRLAKEKESFLRMVRRQLQDPSYGFASQTPVWTCITFRDGAKPLELKKWRQVRSDTEKGSLS